MSVSIVMLAVLVVLAVVVYVAHLAMDKYLVDDNNTSSGIAIISAVVWLIACALAGCAFVAAVMVLMPLM